MRQPDVDDSGVEYCPCGKPLHFLRPDIEQNVKIMVETYGSHVAIRSPEGAWLVPRYYVALHHVSGSSLKSLAELHHWQKVG